MDQFPNTAPDGQIGEDVLVSLSVHIALGLVCIHIALDRV
jgi:hypothetical protein